MEIIKKPTEEIKVGTLAYGDVFESVSGRVFMVVSGTPYIEDDGTDFKIIVVDLEKGFIDRIRADATARPMNLVAKEV